MDIPFEGIPTVPPPSLAGPAFAALAARMAFYCNGKRYIVTASPDMLVREVKSRLFAGGIARANRPAGVSHTPGIRAATDLDLVYAGQRMEDDRPLAEYRVPAGCKTMIAIERALLDSGKLPKDHAYWN